MTESAWFTANLLHQSDSQSDVNLTFHKNLGLVQTRCLWGSVVASLNIPFLDAWAKISALCPE